jgi:hypothetical protein
VNRLRIIPAMPFLIAAQLAFAASGITTGNGTLASRASVDISVTIPKVMQLRLVNHPASLEITSDDVARGSVRVTGASLDLLVNDRLGFELRADLLNAMFTAVRIAGSPSMRFASMVGRPRQQPFPVEYELQLAPGATPGRYAWPVSLSIQQP